LSWLELLLIPLGFAVGAYGTLVGAGGGFVLVPALLIIYSDDSQRELTAISLAVVLANSMSGSLAFARQRLIDYRTGLTFAAATVPSSFAGAYFVRFVPRFVFDQVFGVMMISLAVITIYGALRRTEQVRPPVRAGRGIVVRTMDHGDGVVSRYAYNVWVGIAFSVVIGFASSLFGVGGGIMQVPVMVTVLRVPVEFAVATSQFMLVFMAAAGTTLHVLDGEFGQTELTRAALLAAGAVPGALTGAFIGRRLSGSAVARLLALVLVIVGFRLVLTPLF
jgi:uncharacterized membrane protein YfcA